MIRRIAVVVLLTLLLAAALFMIHPRYGERWVTFARSGAGRVDEIAVQPGQLTFSVDATGVLRASSARDFGAPPEFQGAWVFQLVNLAPEGKNVRKGDPLLVFDAPRIRQDLDRFKNEHEQARKELERTRVQIQLEEQELRARLAEAENRYQKARLKDQFSSAAIDASRNVELDRLALEQVSREVEAIKERIKWHRSSSEAAYNIIAGKQSRAEARVAEIERGIATLQAQADRDGVVIYKLKWNGERFQVGENVYSGMPVLEIPDLNTIVADTFVPEVDLGRIRLGQRADITMDTFPGKSLAAKVTKIGTLVRPRSYDIPNKILEVQLSLDRIDTAIMRPGMSLKARIETGRLSDVLTIPLRAVHTTAQGSWVRVRAGGNWRDQQVKIGESDGTSAVLLEGLRSGDRIAADFMRAR